MRSLSILLCGYGWFAGIPEGETNNAELIARALDGETLVCGDVRATVRGMTMPVLWRGAFEPVQAAIDAQKPDLVLALGTDARAGALRPEPLASTGAGGATRATPGGKFPDLLRRSGMAARHAPLCADGARHARRRRARPAWRADPPPRRTRR